MDCRSKAGARVADSVVQVAAGFDLKARQKGDDFAIGLDHRLSNVLAGAILGEKLEEGGVSQIFFQIGAVVQVLGVDFRAPAGRAGENAAKIPERRRSPRGRRRGCRWRGVVDC